MESRQRNAESVVEEVLLRIASSPYSRQARRFVLDCRARRMDREEAARDVDAETREEALLALQVGRNPVGAGQALLQRLKYHEERLLRREVRLDPDRIPHRNLGLDAAQYDLDQSGRNEPYRAVVYESQGERYPVNDRELACRSQAWTRWPEPARVASCAHTPGIGSRQAALLSGLSVRTVERYCRQCHYPPARVGPQPLTDE